VCSGCTCAGAGQPTFQCNSPLKVPAPAPFSFVTTLLDQAAGLLVSFCSNRQVLYRTKSQLAPIRKGGEDTMKLLKRLLVEEHGQGLVEYTLIVVLVALVFWVAIKNTNIGSQLASGWSNITACVGDPSGCDTAS
jgi:Flp pilus assembly pilin Flp